MVNIGKRIKSARQKVGMSQEELAQTIGVTKSTISKYEKGAREPRYDQLQRIATALGTSISNLLPPDNYWEDEDGIGHTEPQVVEHEGPLQRAEVVEHSATPEELEALLAKLQDGKPLLLSPDKLAKLKATPKEQVAAALEKAEQEEQGHIVHISAPYYRLRGMSPERREQLKAEKDRAVRYEHSLGVSHLASDILGQLNAPQRRIATALGKLNEEGQEKAAERVEELTEIPRYRRQEPAQKLTKEELRESLKRLGMDKLLPDGPQDTPAPQESIDTTPAEMPPEEPIKPSEAVIMICPICGQHLIGNSVTGKAYCNYCKRSFPLPQILK